MWRRLHPQQGFAEPLLRVFLIFLFVLSAYKFRIYSLSDHSLRLLSCLSHHLFVPTRYRRPCPPIFILFVPFLISSILSVLATFGGILCLKQLFFHHSIYFWHFFRKSPFFNHKSEPFSTIYSLLIAFFRNLFSLTIFSKQVILSASVNLSIQLDNSSRIPCI